MKAGFVGGVVVASIFGYIVAEYARRTGVLEPILPEKRNGGAI